MYFYAASKLVIIALAWLISTIASTNAQATSKETCTSLNNGETGCLMEYIKDKFEQYSLKSEQFVRDTIEEKLAEQHAGDSEQTPTNCHDLWTRGYTQSDEYSIYVPNCVSTSSGSVCHLNETHIRVYCDMDDSNGGPGWIVFQRRLDGSVNFTRDWNAYKHGFGDLNGELWLGNDNIAKITASDNFQLRVDLGDWEERHYYAEYSFIRVLGEQDKYQLYFGDYSGDAGDALAHPQFITLNGSYFTTIDRDNDQYGGHCGGIDYFNAGFWSSNCGAARLNGAYLFPDSRQAWMGILWYNLLGNSYSLKTTVMKIRPNLN